MTKEIITQKELKKILQFNPETGIFVWRKKPSPKISAGCEAGSIDNGYIIIRIRKRAYRAHRLAWLYMYSEWPKHQIDHINHNRADNSISNLRETTNQENQKNQKIFKKNKVGVAGVGWHKQAQRWYAEIGVDNKSIYLGRFPDKFEAICARKSAERKYGFHINHGHSQLKAG